MPNEETKNTLAIIISHRPYREADRLVSFYSRDFGKQRLLARGASKISAKLAGHLEPFNLAEVMIIKGRHRDYLGAARSLDARLFLKADLNCLFYAGQVLHIFETAVKEAEPDPELFFLLEEFLESLNKKKIVLAKERGEILLSAFVFKLLYHLGYGLRLDSCLSCNRSVKNDKEVYIDILKGGFFCSSCFNREVTGILPNISSEALKTVKFFVASDFKKIARLVLEENLIREISGFVMRYRLAVLE